MKNDAKIKDDNRTTQNADAGKKLRIKTSSQVSLPDFTPCAGLII